MMSNSEIKSATNDTLDWCLCCLCQSDVKEPTTKLSTSVKLKKTILKNVWPVMKTS